MTTARTPPVRLVAVTEDDWERARDLRLQMLADTPTAYVETLEQARARTEEEWRSGIGRGGAPDGTRLAAVDADGTWVGAMTAVRDEDDEHVAWLKAVYVAPAHRGRAAGVADALLDGVEAWARLAGVEEVRLEVHEGNGRARAFYARRGCVPTGRTKPYPLDPSQRELEMVLRLR